MFSRKFKIKAIVVLPHARSTLKDRFPPLTSMDKDCDEGVLQPK
jgi:hypothetical protein